LTLLGVFLAVLSPFWFKPGSALPEPEVGAKKWVILLVLAVVVGFSFLAINFIVPDASSLLKKGRADFERRNYALARERFAEVMRMSKKSSGPRCEAGVFYATCFLRENRFAEGAEELRKFIKAYPNSFWTPQAYFDLAYCEVSLGNVKSAVRIYQQIMRDFPLTSWAKYSKDRLKELRNRYGTL
jgi:tetratricopeptide (TPR) repeat protein